MPTSVGPNTFGEENLVFGYDLGDTVNSYRGEPTTNLASLDLSNAKWYSEGGTKVLQSETLDGYPVYRFRSSGSLIYVSPLAFNQLTATSNDVTLSAYFRNVGTSAQTVNVFLANDFGTDSNGDPNNRSIPADGKWYRQSWTRYAAANTYNQVEFRTFSDTLLISKPQVEYKKHATPPVEGTRSATQGLIDLTGTSTIDLTNVSFDSDAQMTFDGTDDSISIPHANSPITNLTYELVVRIDSIPASNTFRSIWQKSANWNGDTGISMQMIYGNLTFSYGNNWGGTVQYPLSNLTAGNRYHIVGTADSTSGADVRFYINGVLVDTGTSYQTPTTTSNLTIGLGNGGTLDGKIDVFKMYSRTLTAQEVASNYNAIKSRFSI